MKMCVMSTYALFSCTSVLFHLGHAQAVATTLVPLSSHAQAGFIRAYCPSSE